MSTQSWDVLVRRLERQAQAEPGGYRLRVAALATLGYAYVGAILLAVVGGAATSAWLALTGHAVAVKLLVPLVPLAVLILRALPVRLDPPEGIALRRADAPKLFALIDELRAATGARRIDHVLIDGDLNASVAQVPRFGWFGPTRQYLVIGLPLVTALSDDAFRAVLAHELGHVSARHGRFAAWIYRIRLTWVRLLDTLEEQGHWGAGLFSRFFRWYAPYFAAYSFVLARQHEYEADRASARVAGASAAGCALARLDLAAAYLGESYWPSVYKQAQHVAVPVCRPYAELEDALQAGPSDEHVKRFSRAALILETGTADTHPSLSDRLAALGVEAEAAVEEARMAVRSAAARLLGPSHGGIVERLDDDWQVGVSEWWAAEFRETQDAAARLADLDNRSGAGKLDVQEQLEHATLTDRIRGIEAAVPLYRAVLARNSRNAVANFAVGRALLVEGDETGIGHLDVALTEDPDALLPACELAIAFLCEQGRAREAEPYRARASARNKALEDARAERTALRTEIDVRAHGLPPEVTLGIARQLPEFREVRRAYPGRRVHVHLDDEFPSYVLGVDLHVPRWKPHLGDPRPGLIRRLAAEIEAPIDIVFFDLKQAGSLRKRLPKVPGAQIYARG
jgi:Zn-dependent protease with chaperone function